MYFVIIGHCDGCPSKSSSAQCPNDTILHVSLRDPGLIASWTTSRSWMDQMIVVTFEAHLHFHVSAVVLRIIPIWFRCCGPGLCGDRLYAVIHALTDIWTPNSECKWFVKWFWHQLRTFVLFYCDMRRQPGLHHCCNNKKDPHAHLTLSPSAIGRSLRNCLWHRACRCQCIGVCGGRVCCIWQSLSFEFHEKR